MTKMHDEYRNNYELIMGVSKRAHQIADNHEGLEASLALTEAIDELLWGKYSIHDDRKL